MCKLSEKLKGESLVGKAEQQKDRLVLSSTPGHSAPGAAVVCSSSFCLPGIYSCPVYRAVRGGNSWASWQKLSAALLCCGSQRNIPPLSEANDGRLICGFLPRFT